MHGLSLIIVIVEIVWVVLGLILYILFPRYLFGLFPQIKARELTENEKQRIKEYGLSHCTDMKGYAGITNDMKIKMSKKDNAYSNQYKPCVYLCINDGVGAVAGINRNTKYKKKLIIKNITDEQISKMKIRSCDEAIHYQDEFILVENNIAWEDVKVDSIPHIKYLKEFFTSKDEYIKCFRTYFALVLGIFIMPLLFGCALALWFCK